jgi:hypothetical protein
MQSEIYVSATSANLFIHTLGNHFQTSDHNADRPKLLYHHCILTLGKQGDENLLARHTDFYKRHFGPSGRVRVGIDFDFPTMVEQEDDI